MNHPKSPGFIFPDFSCVIHSDPWRGDDFAGETSFFNPKTTGCFHIFTVKSFVQTDGFPNSSGSDDSLKTPDQDSLRMVFWACDNIQKPVNAIDKIGIDKTPAAKHDFRSGCPALTGMVGAVFHSMISFCFYNG